MRSQVERVVRDCWTGAGGAVGPDAAKRRVKSLPARVRRGGTSVLVRADVGEKLAGRNRERRWSPGSDWSTR